MHYSTMLITKDIPSYQDIIHHIELYNEVRYGKYDEDAYRGKYINEETYQKTTCPIAPIDCPIRPLFYWDWFELGGRYNGRLKLGINFEDKKYNWSFYAKEPRNGRLFHSYLLNHSNSTFEEDLYNTMGFNDGFLYVDGAKMSDVQNMDEVSAFYCIDTINHNVTMQDHFDYDECRFIKNDNFEEEIKQIKENTKRDGFVTILDLHD